MLTCCVSSLAWGLGHLEAQTTEAKQPWKSAQKVPRPGGWEHTGSLGTGAGE